jgi:myo-inositol-1(or 4)-monophosphatase
MDPDTVHPALEAATRAALETYRRVIGSHDRGALGTRIADGADDSPSLLIDIIVESAILSAVEGLGVNVLSEEAGWIDGGHALTLVVDPVDGSANAAAGVPFASCSAALAVDGRFVEAMTVWLHTGERYWARADDEGERCTTGRRSPEGAFLSMLRPRSRNRDAWWRVVDRASRIRVLGSSTIESALVATGAVDAFVDAGSDSHRLVDLAAALVLVPAAGGVVVDAFGRPIELDTDLTRRWSGVVAATPELAEGLCELIASPGAGDGAGAYGAAVLHATR